MKAKIWIIILLFLVNITIAIADEGDIEIYKPREIFDLSIHLTNKSGDVKGANCNIQIRNESYDATFNQNMTDIGGGWYNATYNTSQIGKYFCRYNCTQGNLFIANTCDFIIEAEETMNLAIMIIFGVFAFILTALTIASKELILKGFFILLNLGIIVAGINTARLMAIDGGASANIVKMLNTIYSAGIFTLYTLTAVGTIYGLYHLFMYLKNKSKPSRQPNLNERGYNFKLR